MADFAAHADSRQRENPDQHSELGAELWSRHWGRLVLLAPGKAGGTSGPHLCPPQAGSAPRLLQRWAAPPVRRLGGLPVQGQLGQEPALWEAPRRRFKATRKPGGGQPLKV